MGDHPMPHTGTHLDNIMAFVERISKGERMPLPGGKIAGKEAIVILDGEFVSFADKLIVMGDLTSLQTECSILEAVARAAAEVQDPPEQLKKMLKVLHREA